MQTIALTALSLDKEETSECKDYKIQRRSCWIRSWVQQREVKNSEPEP